MSGADESGDGEHAETLDALPTVDALETAESLTVRRPAGLGHASLALGNTERAESSSEDAAALRLEPKNSASGLAIGEVIGEGGMGVVRSAVQRSLARTVAIKTALPGVSAEDAGAMLREAWVTGWLEHPGVVPVHDIVKTTDGTPIVVMRRIRGGTWEDSIRDAKWAEAEGARDLLEQNLRVFVRLCEIVEFAHARGVLHRDIKPGNVMLGAYGEVYLLDWGLALALDDQAAVHLPRAGDTRELTGTFAYVPPEMVGMGDAGLDLRADVYLLGAVLFQIATGRPPHDRPTTRETLASIAASPPRVPDGVPRRLGAICTRAMQKAPRDRYPSVAPLRHDVLEYLRARDSEQVASAAEEALAQLGEVCAARGERRRVYDLYGECRFGFAEALRTWPKNEAAARGLARAREHVIEYELSRDPRVAGALLEEAEGAADEAPHSSSRAVTPPVSAALASRVRAAVAAEAGERDRLAAIAREHDRVTGRGARRALFIGLGIVWTVPQFFADHTGPVTHARFGVASLIQLPIIAIVLLAWRDLTKTAFNRRLIVAIVVFLIAQGALFFVGDVLNVELRALRIMNIGLGAVMSACLMAFYESRVWPMTAGLVLAQGLAIRWPHHRHYFVAAANLGVTLNLAHIWGRPREADASAGEARPPQP